MLWFILPAYNEEHNIGNVLDDIERLCRQLEMGFGVVAVNDGSQDLTQEVLERYARKMPVHIVRHARNQGVGKTFSSGFNKLRQLSTAADTVVLLEADNTNGISTVEDMLKKIALGYDVVCASRWVKGGGYFGFPFKRRVFSVMANLFMRFLFPIRGVRDYTIFCRAYRCDLIMRAMDFYGKRFIESDGFLANAELLFKLSRFSKPLKVAESPLVYHYDFKIGKSKLHIMRTVKEYLCFAIRNA